LRRVVHLRIKLLAMLAKLISQTFWQFHQIMKHVAIYPNRSALQFDLNARLAGCSHDRTNP
jgi:hypothetical protein